jgi:SAM-dependent methyltransferase
MDQRFYPEFASGWDDLAFRDFILKRIKKDFRVLDLGAGAGRIAPMNFRGLAREICGVDPDPRVSQNPYLDDAKVGFGEQIPYEDSSFDLVFADNVLEHLTDPVQVFKEVSRVLRPGGIFLFKTPNRNHYMPLAARLTPHAFHVFYNKLRGRAGDDTFPTVYRANTPAAATAHGGKAGLVPGEFRLMEGRPEYLRFSLVSYACGLAYERVVNATDALQRFRILMIGELMKPAT